MAPNFGTNEKKSTESDWLPSLRKRSRTSRTAYCREGRRDIELVLRIGADVRRDVDLILDQGATMAVEVLEVRVDLTGREVLQAGREPIAVREEWRRDDVPTLGAPVERGLIDHGKAQRVVEVLVVELRLPLEGLVFPERCSKCQAAAAIVVVSGLPKHHGGRVLLARIAPELLQGQGTGQRLLV